MIKKNDVPKNNIVKFNKIGDKDETLKAIRNRDKNQLASYKGMRSWS